jgi:hypothetical protein
MYVAPETKGNTCFGQEEESGKSRKLSGQTRDVYEAIGIFNVIYMVKDPTPPALCYSNNSECLRWTA